MGRLQGHFQSICIDFPCLLDGQNRQSPIASVQRTRPTLGSHSAVPCGTNVKQMNANPIGGERAEYCFESTVSEKRTH